VIRPAEPIMDIVPLHDAMVVEAMISPSDIAHVHPGDDARVRLPGLNRATTPEWAGRVITVAADRSESSEPRQSWYLVQIALDRGAGGQNPADLKSGLPAEVHIAHGSRTLLSYLTKPLSDQFARAFRDN
jgi:HlyD family secretion protein